MKKLNLSRYEERILCDAVTVIKNAEGSTNETFIKINLLVNHIKTDSLTDSEISVLSNIVDKYLELNLPLWFRIPFKGCRRKLKNARETHGD